MTLRIALGAVAALALAGTAHAQSGGSDTLGTSQLPPPAAATAPTAPAPDCYAADPAQCAPTPPSAQMADPYAPGAIEPEEAQSGERWRRPERRGLARLLLPIDLVREGASAVRHAF
jgi:hypothetical protein